MTGDSARDAKRSPHGAGLGGFDSLAVFQGGDPRQETEKT